MRKLDKYMVKSFLGPFFAVLLIVVFSLLLQFLWLYIDELVGKGLSLKVILEFMGWGAATMLPLSLPLATVLASVMTMGNLSENSELIAIKSAGISLSRVLLPLTVTSFLLAVAAFFAANNLVPLAYNEIYTLREDIGKTKEEIKIPTKTFYDGIDGYILRVEENNRKTGMMYGVMVYNHTSGKGNVSLTIADSAMMKMADNKTFLTFAMYNGTNYEETNTIKGRDTTRQLQRTSFVRQEMIIPVEHYEFQKTKVGKYSDQAKSMSLGDLVTDQDSIRLSLTETRKNQIDQLRRSVALQFNKQLDSARASKLKGVLDLSTLRELSLEENIEAHENAVRDLNAMVSTMSGFERETAHPAFTLKLIDIEIYKKFALALVCFLLFFIGAPLGALVRKGGIGTPAIVSVLFFVLYYIVDIVGTKLARDGAIGPVYGAFIASVALVPICGFLTYKAINDEPILGNEKIMNFFHNVKIRLIRRFRKTSIVYMGTPEFAVAPLKALLDAGFKVSAVVTVPDKPSGRGLGVNESAVKKFAVERGIEVLQPVNLRDEAFLSRLTALKPDIIAVVAFRLLPREVWSIPRLGTFNLHAALLPQYRGAAPINWAVINGERTTGVTSFLIDDGVDTGTILIRDQYKIAEDDTAATVHDALMEMGARVVVQTVEGLLEGNLDKRVQKSFIQGEEVLHKAPKLTRELCHIDWTDSPKRIVNLIRGLSDYPCAYTELVSADGSKVLPLKIFKAHLEGDKVIPDEVQLAGKKRMSYEEFRRGFRDLDSYSYSAGTSKAVIDAVRAGEKNS